MSELHKFLFDGLPVRGAIVRLTDAWVELLARRAGNSETGAYLHRMQWAADSEIGEIPYTWNFLEGWYDKLPSGTPNAVHFTRGGPWFEGWQDVDYGDLWRAEKSAFEQKQTAAATR